MGDSVFEVDFMRITEMRVEQPDLPYIMNVSVAAAATNAMAEARAGLSVVIYFDDGRRIESVVFGGMQPQAAYELRGQIDEAMGRIGL